MVGDLRALSFNPWGLALHVPSDLLRPILLLATTFDSCWSSTQSHTFAQNLKSNLIAMEIQKQISTFPRSVPVRARPAVKNSGNKM